MNFLLQKTCKYQASVPLENVTVDDLYKAVFDIFHRKQFTKPEYTVQLNDIMRMFKANNSINDDLLGKLLDRF